jgi:hypothetical protein
MNEDSSPKCIKKKRLSWSEKFDIKRKDTGQIQSQMTNDLRKGKLDKNNPEIEDIVQIKIETKSDRSQILSEHGLSWIQDEGSTPIQLFSEERKFEAQNSNFI